MICGENQREEEREREYFYSYKRKGMTNCQFGGISNKYAGDATRKFIFARFSGGICGIARLIKLKRSCFNAYAVIFRSMVTRTSALRARWHLFDRLARKLSIRGGKSPV